MTTRLIILDCAGYISTFKAVIVFGSKKQISGLKNQFLGLLSQKKPFSKKSKNYREGGFLLGIWEKMRLPKKLEGNEVKYCDFRDF